MGAVPGSTPEVEQRKQEHGGEGCGREQQPQSKEGFLRQPAHEPLEPARRQTKGGQRRHRKQQHRQDRHKHGRHRGAHHHAVAVPRPGALPPADEGEQERQRDKQEEDERRGANRQPQVGLTREPVQQPAKPCGRSERQRPHAESARQQRRGEQQHPAGSLRGVGRQAGSRARRFQDLRSAGGPVQRIQQRQGDDRQQRRRRKDEQRAEVFIPRQPGEELPEPRRRNIEERQRGRGEQQQRHRGQQHRRRGPARIGRELLLAAFGGALSGCGLIRAHAMVCPRTYSLIQVRVGKEGI